MLVVVARERRVASSNPPLQPTAMFNVIRPNVFFLVLVLALMLGSAPAVASTYRGADWGLLFVFYTLPYALVPIGLSVLFAALRLFRNGTFNAVFMLVALLVAGFFLLMALRAPGGFASSAIAVAEIVLVLALTLLPPWLQQAKARAERAAGADNPGSQ